nr:hypothetical protein [Tanacetum cinerariifolium]GEZ51005.1 hypothetical protein [Tanacetum cinerariifolium]
DRLIQKMNEKEADVHKEKVLKEPANIKVLKIKVRKKARKQTHGDDESSDKGMDSSKKRKADPIADSDPPCQAALEDLQRTDNKQLDLVELYNLVMQRFETTTQEEDGTEIHMLAERRYLLTAKTLERMLSLRLIAESASDASYVGFITTQQMVISSPCLTDIKNWLVQKQTTFGKDLSNSLMADSSPKNIWFSTHYAS